MMKMRQRTTRRLSRTCSTVVLAALLVGGLPSVAFADSQKPLLIEFSWHDTLKTISFEAVNAKGLLTYEIESDGDTTFDPDVTWGISEDWYTERTWQITPAPECVGGSHEFTLTLTNGVGTVRATKCLRVVPAGGRGEGAGGCTYSGVTQCVGGGVPAVSEWGLIVMTPLVLAAGAVVLGRRSRSAAA